jgi:hypothetical protein
MIGCNVVPVDREESSIESAVVSPDKVGWSEADSSRLQSSTAGQSRAEQIEQIQSAVISLDRVECSVAYTLAGVISLDRVERSVAYTLVGGYIVSL